MTAAPNHTLSRHDLHRAELAELLELDPATMPDEARLTQDLSLDSLAMLNLLVWLENRGVTVGDDAARPATVGDVLALLDRQAGFPGLSIKLTSATGELAGPVALPELPAAVSPLVPAVAAAGFALSPVMPGDTEFLYWLSSQPETCFRWRYRGAPPAYERFVNDLWSRVLVQFVVRRAESAEPVGHVVAYAADPSLRHAYIGAVFVPQHVGTGLAAQAVSVFVGYVFHTFPLHKLYLEVPGFNWAQLESGAGRLFEVEGVFCGHDYYAGQYWDKRVCAIYRENAVTP